MKTCAVKNCVVIVVGNKSDCDALKRQVCFMFYCVLIDRSIDLAVQS